MRHLAAVPNGDNDNDGADPNRPVTAEVIDEYFDEPNPRRSSRHGGNGGGHRPAKKHSRLNLLPTRFQQLTYADFALWALGPGIALASLFGYRHLFAAGLLVLVVQIVNRRHLRDINPRAKATLVAAVVGAVLITQQPVLGERVWDAAATLVRGGQTAYEQATDQQQPAAEPASPTNP